jgi:hypothetical protein
VPEQNLTGCVYPVIRRNLDVASCSVQIWDDTSEHLYYARYGRIYWHLPIPTDLREWDVANGLSFRCLEPLHRWSLNFHEGDDVAFDLIYEGIHEPCEPHPAGSLPMPPGIGHFDQLCHVTGTLLLDGERFSVDCIEMRDKSWGPRSDGPRLADASDHSGGAYTYGATGRGNGFCAYGIGGTGINGQRAVIAGFLWRDGILGRLTDGTRRRERDSRGRPATVVIEATDEHGRSLMAEGSCVNSYAHLSTPNGFAWMSGTVWALDGETGWGEDQEVWDAATLRRAVREGIVKP